MYFILIQPLDFFFFQSELLGFNRKSRHLLWVFTTTKRLAPVECVAVSVFEIRHKVYAYAATFCLFVERKLPWLLLST